MADQSQDSLTNSAAKQKGKVLIITGMSGAGKSQVIMALEDMGFYCVDNMPPAQEVPKRVIQYIRENNEKPYGEDGVSILISKGYGYIRSTYIDEMINDLGWKCTKDELQDNLLMAGIFEFSKSESEDEKKKRPSHVKRMPSKGFRCWKIRLS